MLAFWGGYGKSCYVFRVGWLLLLSLIGEIFTPAVGDGFPGEFKWQEISLTHEDSSPYSARSQEAGIGMVSN